MTSISHDIKRFGWLLAGLSVFCLAVGVLYFRRGDAEVLPFTAVQKLSRVVDSPEGDAASEATSTTRFIDSTIFLTGAQAFWNGSDAPNDCSVALGQPILILPHYLPGHGLITRALAPWKHCRAGKAIKRVVVVSPDHYQALASGSATLSLEGYATPLGIAAVDRELRLELTGAGVTSQDRLFVREHGAGLFPVFVKQFFPEATYTPVVISNKATEQEVMDIATVLRQALDVGDTLVIISADFSHYLSKREADANDVTTLNALTRKDTTFFWKANDDYTDFGRGVWLGLKLGGPTSTFVVSDRLNSVEVGGSNARTTSFIIGSWR